MEKKVFVIFLFLVLAIFISFPHTCISQTNTFPSTGNVGIGTAAPVTTLDTNGTIRAIGFQIPASGSGLEMVFSSGVGVIQSYNRTTPGFLPTYIRGSVVVLNDTGGGNVGIGHTPANGKLDIKGSLWVENAATDQSISIGAGTTGGVNRISSNYAATGGYLPLVLSGNVGTYPSQLYLDTTGNVGIGTTSPGSQLDVKGTLRLSGSSSGYVGFAPPAGAGSTTYTLPASDGTNGQVLGTNGAGQLSWADKGSSANSAIRVVSFTLPGTAIAGENKTCSFIVPFNFTITKAYAYARTVPTGAALIFDIIKNGTSIWHTNPGNRLQITSSQNMGIQTNFDTTTFAELDIIDIDLVQIGSSIAGADITVEIKGTVS